MGFDISLDSYKIFCSVVKTGSMSAAAKELYVTQPAVSMAVKQLEEKLGKPLVTRRAKGAVATAEGKVMYDYLLRAFEIIESAEKKYAEMAELTAGEIKISASDTIMSRYLLPYIESFVERRPGIGFKITNRTTSGTINLLKNAQADVGFVNLPIEKDPALSVIKCLSVRDCVIGGVKYRKLAGKGITFTDLDALPLMLLERDSNSRRLQDKFAATHGRSLAPAIELGSSDLLVRCVKINLGVAFVTKEFTDIDGETVFEIPFTPRLPERAIGLVMLKGAVLSHAAEGFINHLFNDGGERDK